MADTARPMDAPFTGQFVFKVDGVEIGSFTEVSGLAVEVQVEELQEGGQNHFIHKLPGRMKWPNIVLKRGVTKSDSLFDWFSKSSGEGFSAEGNQLQRLGGEVVLVDAARNPLRRWEFLDAFPIRWKGPTFAASSNQVAMEELEIAHHGFRSSSS